jgi:hypothetical protein
MESTKDGAPDLTTAQLAGELADVEASIALVASGVASSITLTGLRFGRQLVDRLGPSAARDGVELEASFWPEESACDVHIRKAGEVDRG